MGKINGCLKCLFIFFNVLFGIFGVLLIVAAVLVSTNSQGAGALSSGWFWVLAIGTLLISCLGIIAACSERELLLKVFAGLMVVGFIIMMIFGIVCAVNRNKVKAALEDTPGISPMMDDDRFKKSLDIIQITIGCCGWVSAQDWGATIPQSCECRGSSGCTPRPQGASGPDKIYSRSCGGAILSFVYLFVTGIFFTFAVTALLGLLVSLLMIRQIRRHNGGGQSIAMGSGY